MSRTGFLLLSKFDNRIKNFFYFLQSKEPTFKSVSAFLSDDLRLCRWSYLPIINYLLLEESSKVKKEKGCYIDFFKFGWKVFNDSKLKLCVTVFKALRYSRFSDRVSKKFEKTLKNCFGAVISVCTVN